MMNWKSYEFFLIQLAKPLQPDGENFEISNIAMFEWTAFIFWSIIRSLDGKYSKVWCSNMTNDKSLESSYALFKNLEKLDFLPNPVVE